jgi:transcription-repair coupling factor (superfamily II helicase)
LSLSIVLDTFACFLSDSTVKPADFISKYKENDIVKDFTSVLKSADQQFITLSGMAGSAVSVIAAASFKTLARPFVFIMSSRESAAYLFNDIENLLEEKDLAYEKRSVFLFPSSYKKPYQTTEIDNANVLLRSEVINRLSAETKKFFVITYPEALPEKVVSRKVLKKNILTLHAAESTSVDFILELLIEYGFYRVDFVVEPGQFSLRGGIVDVFSYSNDFPYRIEIMGDQVESLRTFNPESQISIEKLEKITILPDLSLLAEKNEKEDFFTILPSHTLFWNDDVVLAKERISESFKLAETVFEAFTSGIKHSSPDELFIDGEVFINKLATFSNVEFRRHFFTGQNTASFAFDFSPQPSFNKNFELLIRDLTEKSSLGFTNYLLSDNPRQLTRIHSIFETVAEEKNKEDFLKHETLNIALHEGFIDHHAKLLCYTDHQIFERYHRFRIRDKFPGKKALTLKEINNLQPGDYITHIDHGVGIFSGLEKIEVNGKLQEAIRLIYKGNDILYISIHSLHRISKYSGKDGTEPVLNRLGSPAWSNLKKKTKSRVKDIAKDLIRLYAERKAKQGYEFAPDTYLQNELEASFIYEDTPDQIKATADFKADMEKPYPMDRLICGDVGFGKTEVAIRAAFKAVTESKQVAILVPTTILALQHYHTFSERLKDFPCNIDYINRFRSAKQKTEILKKAADGTLDILIGTHRLVSGDVRFKDLGLLIIDEEQKFGVSTKEKLKKLKVNVDTLTLTATPIPRTLQFSLMGARDLSLINTPPQNRYPIVTELHVFNEELVRDAIMYEVSRGGQVFFIHNRVQNIEEVAGMIKRLCPDLRIAIGHGQMAGHKLEEVMVDFIDGHYDVLVATSIIESGLDIANANTIMINNPHHFGLSDLHQMRGRVGRTNKKAFCYLLTPPLTTLTEDARKRLSTIEEFSELGSGFNIAMRDLDLRGAGNLLGGEQSGFISEIGFEMYHKILDEAILELKQTEFKDHFADDESVQHDYEAHCVLETDLQLLIPTHYVESTQERLNLYKDLDNLGKESQLDEFAENIKDRFGPVPPETQGLFMAIRLRWLAGKLGFEKIILKSGTFIGHFISNQESPFYSGETFPAIISFVQQNPRKCIIRETDQKLILTVKHIMSVEEAYEFLSKMKSS